MRSHGTGFDLRSFYNIAARPAHFESGEIKNVGNFCHTVIGAVVTWNGYRPVIWEYASSPVGASPGRICCSSDHRSTHRLSLLGIRQRVSLPELLGSCFRCNPTTVLQL